MTYRNTISLFGSLVLVGACSLDPKNIGTPDDGGDETTSSGTTADGSESSTGDPTVAETGTETGTDTTAETTAATDDPTGSTTSEVEEPCTPGPGCVACMDVEGGVGAIELKVTMTPEAGFDQPIFIEGTCVIEERLTSGVQDGLLLGCMGDDSEFSLRIEYGNGQLLLPDAAAVGLEVVARFVQIENESQNYWVAVRAIADDRLVLAAHKGPALIPFVEGVGALEDFWAPLQIEEVTTACPGMPGFCESVVQRSALQFTVEGEEAVIFDHQVAPVGPYGIHLGDVITAVSSDNMCDGGTDQRRDFAIVHHPL